MPHNCEMKIQVEKAFKWFKFTLRIREDVMEALEKLSGQLEAKGVKKSKQAILERLMVQCLIEDKSFILRFPPDGK